MFVWWMFGEKKTLLYAVALIVPDCRLNKDDNLAELVSDIFLRAANNIFITACLFPSVT